ncbi:MAG: tetratricopeptide repeat protein [Calditrichaeota bacterium]|nr:tetratricopeptide repeat protein [Calditrichota bacterium]
METLGLNETLVIDQRKFYIETNYIDEENRVVSHVFENGMLLETRERNLYSEVKEEHIQESVKELQRESVRRMEVLFYVQKKVWRKKHALSYNKLGVVFLQKNLIADAKKNFQEAIAIDEDLIDAQKNLAIAFIKNQEFDQALKVLNRAIEKEPNFPDLHNYKGIALLGKKNFLDSIQAFETALSLSENYPLAHLNMGLTYLSGLVESPIHPQLLPLEERQQKCLEHLKRAADLDRDLRMPEFDSVIRLVQDSQFREALDELLEIHSSRAFRLNSVLENEFYLNFMFGGKSKDEQAVETYIENLKAEIARYPRYPDLHNNLGVAYLIQCRNLFLRALEEFRRAIKLNPNYKLAKKNLKLAENEGKGLLILLRALLK